MVTASLQIQMSNMAEGGPETYRCDDAMMPWLHSEAVCEGIFCVLSFFLKEKQKVENVFYRWYFVTDAFFDKKTTTVYRVYRTLLTVNPLSTSTIHE